MPENLSETANFDPNVSVPVDGVDRRTALSLRPAFQALANRTRNLLNRLAPLEVLDIASRLAALEGSRGARVHRSNDQSINSGVPQAVVFNTETFDTGNFFNAGQPTRLTAPSAGIYQISAQILWTIPGAGSYGMDIRINGGAAIAAVNRAVGSGEAPEMNLVTLAQLAAGDYVELFVFQSSGAAVNLFGQARTPVLCIARVG